MNRLLLAIALLPLFFSCKKEEALISDSTELQQQADWETETFKSNYTIQFPGYYAGGYMQGFEGPSFKKTRDDARTNFTYEFTNGLHYFDFGDTLADESIDSISVGDLLTILPNRLDFTQDGETAGILFYNEVWSISTGVLYWKDEGIFKNALAISYANDMKEEVITILKTIQHN